MEINKGKRSLKLKPSNKVVLTGSGQILMIFCGTRGPILSNNKFAYTC